MGWLAPLIAALVVCLAGSNIALFHVLQRISQWIPAPAFDTFWESATYAGDGLAVCALVSLLLCWRLNAAVAAFAGAAPAGLVTRIFHAWVPIDRPPHVLASGDLTVLGPALQHGSFPSGHAVAAALLAGVVVLASSGVMTRLLAIVYALTVAISRSAVGVHWPIDTLTGIAIGWACAWFGWRIASRTPRRVRCFMRTLIAVLVLFGGIGLLFHSGELPAAVPFRYALALVSMPLAAMSLRRGLMECQVRRIRQASSCADACKSPTRDEST
jgi:membrane-associated phospholipid phosphatase